jgi:hypothetical protein
MYPSSLTLDSLAHLDCAALDALFAEAEPVALSALQGDPKGRALAVPGWDRGWRASLVRTLHGVSFLPWEGKSFGVKPGAAEGVGTNRLRVLGRRAAFDFKTYETASRVDGRPALAIDYDVASNPKLARAIYDELRSVREGLYLGRGMRRGHKGDVELVVWFALDANDPNPKVKWSGY